MLRKLLLFFLIVSFPLLSATQWTESERQDLSLQSKPFTYPDDLPDQHIEKLRLKYIKMLNEGYIFHKDSPELKQRSSPDRYELDPFLVLLYFNFAPDENGKVANDTFRNEGGIEVLKIAEKYLSEDDREHVLQFYLSEFQKIYNKYFLDNHDQNEHMTLIEDFSVWLRKIENKEYAFRILNAAVASSETLLNDNNFEYLVSINSNTELVLMDSISPFTNMLQLNFINLTYRLPKARDANVKIFDISDSELDSVIKKKKEIAKSNPYFAGIEIQELIEELQKARQLGEKEKLFDVLGRLEKVLEAIYEADQGLRSFKVLFDFIVDGSKNEYYAVAGDLKEAKKIDQKIIGYIDELLIFLDKMLSEESVFLGGKNPDILANVVRWLSYSEISGNKDKLIEIYKKLIELSKSQDTVGFKTARSSLLELIAKEYGEVGDYKSQESYLAEARNLALETGQLSLEQAVFQTTYNLKNGNLALAYYANAIANDECNKNSYGTFCDQFIFNEDLILEQIYSLIPDKKNELQNLDYIDRTNLLVQINPTISPEKGEIIGQEIVNYSIDAYDFYLISHLENSDNLVLMEIIENILGGYAQYPEQYKSKINWLSFISKIYINLFIDHTNNIKLISNSDHENILSASNFLLRNIANIFYETEDFDSLKTTLNLIKENEYTEFIRRSDFYEIKNLSLNNDELIFKNKLRNLKKDIDILESLYRESDEKRFFNKEIEKKKLQFRELVNNLYIASKQTKVQVSKNKNIKNDEVLFQYIVDRQSLYLYITNFEGSINQILLSDNFRDIRLKVLKLSSQINKDSDLNQDLLSELSTILLPSNLESFIGPAKRIKFINDDVLNIFPLDILSFNNQNILEKFTMVESVQISKESQNSDNSNLNIFYAQNAFISDKYKFSSLPSVDDEARYIKQYSSNRFSNIEIYPNEKFDINSLLSNLKLRGNNMHISTHVKAGGSAYDQVVMMLGNNTITSLKEIDESYNDSSLNMLILSACDTADLSMDAQSKVFTGMSTFFHKKGANNVISTLWSIDDKATSIFMALLYDIYANNNIDWPAAINHTKNYFRTGRNISSGIHISIDTKTQQQIKSYSHPYYWAAFQLSTTN